MDAVQSYWKKKVSWVKQALLALSKGEYVKVRPHGGSMRGRIESGQLVTIAPVSFDELSINDIIFVRWKGNYLLHLVKDIESGRVLIGNNVGRTNGWVPAQDVLGRVTAVAD